MTYSSSLMYVCTPHTKAVAASGSRHDAGRIPVLTWGVGAWRVTIECAPFSARELATMYDGLATTWSRRLSRLGMDRAYRRLMVQLAADGPLRTLPDETRVLEGLPLVGDGRILEVTSMVWATGFVQDFSWIKLPVFDDAGTPIHYRGVVERAPGLCFLGLPFLYTLTSHLVGGVGRDAAYIADHIASQPPPLDVPPPSRREHIHETHVL